jgi:iron-sulfur cluster repair protein YtfE (RIC family)
MTMDACYTELNSAVSILASHARYEERKLFPFIEHRYKVSVEHLNAAHERLHDAENRLLAAVQEARAQMRGSVGYIDTESAVALLEAALEYDEVLINHMGEEEDIVVPALLHLTIEEYQRYFALCGHNYQLNTFYTQVLRRAHVRGSTWHLIDVDTDGTGTSEQQH